MDLNPAELSQDVHRLLDDLAKRRPDRRHVVAGECMPVVDVFETDDDRGGRARSPRGVVPDAVRVLFKSGVILVVGEKERPDMSWSRGPASFHLVERDFGRFARALKIYDGDLMGGRFTCAPGQRRVADRAAADPGAARRRTARADRKRLRNRARE